MSLFRQAPALCGRLFAASTAASAAGAAAGACPHAGVAAAAVGAAAVARKTPSPTTTTQVCGFSASAAAAPTIFEKLGGKPAVTAAVEKFYQKVLADPTVNSFFANVDMAAQKRKQMSFMMFAFGGPEAYKGKDMFEAHKKMDLKEEHFNAICKHFVETLQELKVDQKYIDEAAAVVMTTKDAVLKQGQYAGKA